MSAMSDAQMQERVGEVLDGRYALIRYVESGGLGDIYEAVDQRLEFRKVALKLLKAETPPDQLARFKREAMLTGGLSSPHLVKTTDFGFSADGRAYLVMEFLRGESLADLLIREQRLPLARAQRIVDGVLAGLEAAHNAGVVHRDLKPENVFIVREPGVEDHPKILDFGFARVFEGDGQTLDVTGAEAIVVGTVSYMAPEQLRGKPTDHRADLFSVGALLFRMLTGELPYETQGDAGMKTQAMFRALRLDLPPRRLAELAPAFMGQDALDAILVRALHVDKAQRFESAGAMRGALADCVGAARLAGESSVPGAAAGLWSESEKGQAELDALRQGTHLDTTPTPAASELSENPESPERPLSTLAVLGLIAVVLVPLAYLIWRAAR